NDFIYPYAEADGVPVKATYEVRYMLPGVAAAPPTVIVSASPANPTSQDLQRQIDELKKIVTDQAQEIAKLKGQKTADKPGPEPVTTASREKVGFYGFARVDTIMDSDQTNNAQIPFFVNSPSNANVVG